MTPQEAFSWKDLGLGPVQRLEERVGNRKEVPDDGAISMLLAADRKRYEYCLETVVKQQEIWTVWDDDQLVEYGADPTWTPIFPTRQFLNLASRNDEGMSAVPIPLDDFVNEIIPYLAENNAVISMFPSSETQEVVLLDWRNFLVELTGAWESLHAVEANSSPAFCEFCYQTVTARIQANARGSAP